MKTFLRYDDSNMWSSACGLGGASKVEMKALNSKLATAKKNLDQLHQTNQQGWFDLAYDDQLATSLMLQSRVVKRNFTDLIVIGIGGSNLGAKTIWQALGDNPEGVNLHFLDNPDPEVLDHWIHSKKVWKKTAINVISKSGSTLETMSIFMLLRHKLIKTVGQNNHHKHIWVTTQPGEGILSDLAKKNNYQIMEYPNNVGGRFSVLSSVGLFPVACGGVDVRKIIRGAKTVEQSHRRQGINHISARFAALHYLGMKKRKQKIHVLMPYAQKLQNLGLWYRQLWAESLGKDLKGPTPIAALGPVDQHSQLQLYQDGPNDKIVTFVQIDNYRKSVTIPQGWAMVSGVDYMRGINFAKIMQVELKATAKSLAVNDRASGILKISEISPESLGALFHFYLLATAYMGELMNINTYNQPGVQDSKTLTKALLR